MKKTERVYIRCSKKEKEVIKRLAKKNNQTISRFIVTMINDLFV